MTFVLKTSLSCGVKHKVIEDTSYQKLYGRLIISLEIYACHTRIPLSEEAISPAESMFNRTNCGPAVWPM